MIIHSVSEIIGQRKLPHTTPTATVRDACGVMEEFNVGSVAVLDQGALVGILCERDVIRKCVCGARRTAETQVQEVMTRDPRVVTLNAGVAEALRIMIDGEFRHLPVVDGDRTVGMLSIRDVPTEYRMMLERFEEFSNHKPR